LAVGDFNHDGRDDIVFINGNQISVCLGQGNGTFQQSSIFSLSKGPDLFSVVARDINGDGNLDVVAAAFSKNAKYSDPGRGWPYSSGTEYDYTWLGNGDGTFGHVSSISHKVNLLGWPTGVLALTSTSADFNHDGIIDQASLSSSGADAASILVQLGNGDGTYSVPQTYAAGPSPASIAAGDFNGDGWIDLIVVNALSSGTPTLTVLLNDGK
jgi:hypothetical protein